jgi:hypothetical protein
VQEELAEFVKAVAVGAAAAAAAASAAVGAKCHGDRSCLLREDDGAVSDIDQSKPVLEDISLMAALPL